MRKTSKGAYSLIKGDDCNDKFIRLIRKLDKTFILTLKTKNYKIDMTEEQKEEFKKG